MMEKSKNRIESVDTIRLLAIVSVIAIHTSPFLNEAHGDDFFYYFGVSINQFSRFAVPFFFVISGFFWGQKVRCGHDPLAVTNAMARRIVTIFIAWSVIYLLPYNLSAFYDYGILGPLKFSYWNIIPLIQKPYMILLEGTKIHLWFLVSLLFALYIACWFVKRSSVKLLFVFTLCLFVAGVLFKPYALTPIGGYVDFNTRNGPFFSSLLFTTGYIISGTKPTDKWLYYGLVLFLIGCILHFAEIYMLMKSFGGSLLQDYVFGTYFMGVGAAILSLSNHKVLRVTFLSDIGRLVLGIYATHLVFIDILKPVDKLINSAVWELCYILIVLMLSIFAAKAMSKSHILKRIVS